MTPEAVVLLLLLGTMCMVFVIVVAWIVIVVRKLRAAQRQVAALVREVRRAAHDVSQRSGDASVDRERLLALSARLYQVADRESAQ